MNVIGIICEYNPFHKGHVYHIKKIKEMYPESIIIACISNCFTQRGEISILNKWDKTKIALNNGIDLVIELPFVYGSQSADKFAYAALKILNTLLKTELCLQRRLPIQAIPMRLKTFESSPISGQSGFFCSCAGCSSIKSPSLLGT